MWGTVRRRACTLACTRQRKFSTIQIAAKPNPLSLLVSQYKPSSMPRVPLTEPSVPSEMLPSHTTASTREAPQISALPNGLRLVSSNSKSPVATIAVLIDSGSRQETPSISGISSFINSMALSSTHNNSEYLITQTLGRHGIALNASVTKESTMYVAHTLQKHLPVTFDILNEALFNLAFSASDVEAAREAQREVFAEHAKSGTVDYADLIHRAAYGNTTLGLPIAGEEKCLDRFTNEALTAWTKVHWRPSRMVISGVGVDHATLTKLAERYFGQKEDSAPTEKTKKMQSGRPAEYTGGEVRNHVINGSSHIMLGFETASWRHEREVYAMSVLQQLMGGGESFSAGGPGKGMYSRLYTNILNRFRWANSASASNAIYADTGLFFLYGHGPAHKSSLLLASLTTEAVGMLKVTEEEVARAKNQLQNNVLMQMEGRDIQAEDLAKQVQLFGKVDSEQHLIDNVRSISVKDVQAAALRMLMSPISLVIHGDTSGLPTREQIQYVILHKSGLGKFAERFQKAQEAATKSEQPDNTAAAAAPSS